MNEVKCQVCGSGRVEARPVAPNATGRPEDQQHEVEVACLDCGATARIKPKDLQSGQQVGGKRVVERR